MLGLKIIAVFVMSAAIGALYRIPRNSMIYGALNGTVAWLVTYGLLQGGANIVAACFLGAVAVGLGAEILARSLCKPATVFIIPGFIPLVPGGEAYTTMRLFVEGQNIDAVSMGVRTVLMAGAIAFGIIISVTAYRLSATNEDYGAEHADKS